MTDRVTLAQVAEEAGVSVMTVSNVLNGKPGASTSTRTRITQVAEKLGYAPNAAARGLKSGKTGLIGVMTLDLTTQYALEIVRGIADELAIAELELLISATHQDSTREFERVDFLTRGTVDAVILVAPVLEDRTIELLGERGRPFVVVDPRKLETPVPRIVVDNYHGTREVTEYLIALGHSEIAYIGGDPEFDSSAARLAGFVDAMKLASLSVDERMIRSSDFTYAAGVKVATRLLEEHHPTAIVAGSDLIALGAIDAARALGKDVPADISVTGFDDLPQARDSYPGLTTIRQPLHDMGQTAARSVLSQLNGNPPLLERMQLPTRLIVRGTASKPDGG